MPGHPINIAGYCFFHGNGLKAYVCLRWCFASYHGKSPLNNQNNHLFASYHGLHHHFSQPFGEHIWSFFQLTTVSCSKSEKTAAFPRNSSTIQRMLQDRPLWSWVGSSPCLFAAHPVLYLEDLPLSRWLGSPPFISHLGHLEGKPTPVRGLTNHSYEPLTSCDPTNSDTQKPLAWVPIWRTRNRWKFGTLSFRKWSKQCFKMDFRSGVNQKQGQKSKEQRFPSFHY